ncbi:MAG: polyprenyl synthetase family protein [Proteobacteria bacterium]|nr:polyprenyl synthetase family protein [Pseudomonadota bacterium]
MVEAITQESIYEPVSAGLQTVVDEIASIAGQTPGNASQNSFDSAIDLDAQLGHVLATPGKRVRPALTLLSSRLWGHDIDERSIKMATAVELLHIATLVHDDTVDHADTRRGHQTASKLWGRNVAVLIGDFIFATSAMYVCDTDNISLVRRFAETITELARGELNEIYTAWQPGVPLEEYNQRIYDKTASLFCTAAESGAVLGEVDDDQNRWQGECFVFDMRVAVDRDLAEGGYVQCHACRRPLSSEDLRSADYREGVSCPHCIGGTNDDRLARLEERRKQVALAEKRGDRHIGPNT